MKIISHVIFCISVAFNVKLKNQYSSNMRILLVSNSSFSYHFVASSDENSDSTSVLAFFNDQHTVFGCSKCNFFHYSSVAKFISSQFTESWNNSSTCSYSNKLKCKEGNSYEEISLVCLITYNIIWEAIQNNIINK